jgi:hypothetical protein
VTHATRFEDRPDGRVIVHDRSADKLPELVHPADSEWVWTGCCGFVAARGEILEPPIPAEQPLMHPDELVKLGAGNG